MYAGTLFGPIIGVTCSLIAAAHLDVAVAQTIFSLVPFVVMAITTVIHKNHCTGAQCWAQLLR
ncbi:MAG: hypothetical protein IPF59_14145 [Ignavibacteria bacterium]|nr:hypothetical protein [Ignavibacteria bacterium]